MNIVAPGSAPGNRVYYDNVVLHTLPPEPLTVDAGADAVITPGCTGVDCVNLAATPNNERCGLQYLWSPTVGLSDPAISNPIACPTSTTTYMVTVTDPCTGAIGTDEVVVTVEPLGCFTVTKSVNDTYTYSGAPLLFTFTVCNNGLIGQNVELTDYGLINFVATSSSPTWPNFPSDPLSILVGPNDCATVEVAGYFTALGTYTNCVEAEPALEDPVDACADPVTVLQNCPLVVFGSGDCVNGPVQMCLGIHSLIADVNEVNFTWVFPSFLDPPSNFAGASTPALAGGIDPSSTISAEQPWPGSPAGYSYVDVHLVYNNALPTTQWIYSLLCMNFTLAGPVTPGVNLYQTFASSVVQALPNHRVDLLDSGGQPIQPGGFWTQAANIILTGCPDILNAPSPLFTIDQVLCTGEVSVTASVTDANAIHMWTWGDDRTTPTNGAQAYTYNYFAAIPINQTPAYSVPPAAPGTYTITHTVILNGVASTSTLHFSAKDTATLKELAGGNKYPDAPKHTPITDLLRLFTQTQWVEVMKILAVHEFAFKSEMNGGDPNKSYYDYMAAFNSEFGGLGADILGVYRPEEHLDNPKYLKNESIYGAAELDHPVRYQHEPPNALKTSSTLSTGLREDEERLPDGSGPLDVDEAEMMKNFLLHDIDADRPSPMSYFEEQLKLAVQKGRNKKGLRHLGAALHVLEDYYAHSNFVEIALIKIGEHKVWPWVDMTPEVKDLTNGAAKALLIPVTTGYFSSADTLASVVPKVAEVFFGPAPPYKPLQAGHRTFAEVLAQYFLYARSKNEEELEEDQRTKLLGWTYAELLAALLWVFKQRDDFRRARDEGGFWGPILRGAGEGAYWMGNALAFFPKLIITKFLEVVPPAILELQTKVGPPLQDDPSHTQLAKDPPNHHLNELAGELAVEAVRDVGERLKACWSGTTTAQSLVQHVRTRYFKHPSQTDWMDDHVKRWATRHTAEVGRAQVATPVDHIERKLDEYVQKTLPTEIKAIRKILGL